jgi:hypothetical protein
MIDLYRQKIGNDFNAERIENDIKNLQDMALAISR